MYSTVYSRYLLVTVSEALRMQCNTTDKNLFFFLKNGAHFLMREIENKNLKVIHAEEKK